MLYVTITPDVSLPDECWGSATYFDNAYEPWWIDNNFAKRVIEDIDESHVVAPRIIDSPYLGYVDPTHLSSGVKLILCLAFANEKKWKFNLTRAGDNCMRWIQMLSKEKDLYVYLSHLPRFDDSVYFEIMIENNGRLCKCQWDILTAWAEVGF